MAVGDEDDLERLIPFLDHGQSPVPQPCRVEGLVDRLHLTERITRVDYNTLKYDVTVDDPGAYTAPWTSGFNLRWTPDLEVWEFMCQGNNLFPETVFFGGDEGRIDPVHVTTP